MSLIDTSNPNANWFEVLSLWNRVASWSHYKTTEGELKTQLMTLLTYLWNEKDWLKSQFSGRAGEIEVFINSSKHLKVVADLANTVKHRKLDWNRSDAQQTSHFGKITFTDGSSRRLYIIKVDGKHIDIMDILRGAIEEYEDLRFKIGSGGIR